MGTVKQTISNSNNRGFTLIEVMVALMILTVGMLGLLQSVNVALEHNLYNRLRGEAVQIGENQMQELISRPFDLLSTATPPNKSYPLRQVGSKIRGGDKTFTVERTAVALTADSREIEVQVRWRVKNYSTSHQVKYTRSR